MAGWMIGGADESHACMDAWATYMDGWVSKEISEKELACHLL